MRQRITIPDYLIPKTGRKYKHMGLFLVFVSGDTKKEIAEKSRSIKVMIKEVFDLRA